MKQRLPKSIISAFLDGELPPRQHARLAKMISRKPEFARKIEELRRISQSLSQLAKVPVPPSVLHEALRKVKNSTSAVFDLAQEELEVVLVAYAYGELEPELVAELESLILHDGQTRDEVRYHRRIARALASLRRSAPSELIEQLSDKLKQVGAEWRPVTDAVVSSSDSTRLRRAVSTLPRASAPSDLMTRVMDEIRQQAKTATPNFARRRRVQSNGWVWISVALTVGLVALVLPRVLDGNRIGMPSSSSNAVANSASADRDQDANSPVDFSVVDDWEKLAKENPSAFADAVDAKQVTFAVDDVDRVLQEIEETVGKIEIKESEPSLTAMYPAYILDVSGKPDAVGQLLAKVERMRKRGEFVAKIGVEAPTQEVLAELNQEQPVTSGHISSGSQADPAYGRPTKRLVGQVALDELLPPRSIATNGRSIRVLLVVEPAKKTHAKGTK